MLTNLSLKDFAVVTTSQLGFCQGFTVVTGETGAGKSLIVDALLCISGSRADSGMVRYGADRAEIAAEFDLNDAPQALAWLIENELNDGSECLVRRVIKADGGSKAWINGRNATLSQLNELCSGLLEIHGQHEQQSLLDRNKQLDLLDEFAQQHELKQQVRQLHRSWLQINAEITALQKRGDVSEQIEYMQHQLSELQALTIDPEHIQVELDKHKRQSQSTQLVSDCAMALTLLQGDEGLSARNQLRSSIAQLNKWQDSEPKLTEVLALLESADIQMHDAINQLQDFSENIELDDQQLLLLESQIATWHELSRKHRVPVLELQDKATRLEIELNDLHQSNSRVAGLQLQLKEAKQQWLLLADKLSLKRQKAAESLSIIVSQLMTELGMTGGIFEVQLNHNENDEPQSQGLERCEFLVSANPGQPTRALRKVASGGELARISLAIEVATLGMDPTPTMVFDEVDSGIGGAIAEVVGQKLRALGKQCQVLCVTHLAQVASLGHQHYLVSKFSEQNNTQSQVKALKDKDRIEEIARMMGGAALSSQSRDHAEVMLNHGQL
jgi:DNA repair protein RecN (Recombination protein N)